MSGREFIHSSGYKTTDSGDRQPAGRVSGVRRQNCRMKYVCEPEYNEQERITEAEKGFYESVYNRRPASSFSVRAEIRGAASWKTVEKP